MHHMQTRYGHCQKTLQWFVSVVRDAGSAASRATTITCRHLASLPSPVHPQRKPSLKEVQHQQQQQRVALESMLQLHLSHSCPENSQALGRQLRLLRFCAWIMLAATLHSMLSTCSSAGVLRVYCEWLFWKRLRTMLA